MKNLFAFLFAALCLFLASCHRPVAYFHRTPHVAARLSVEQPAESKLLNTASDTLSIKSLSDSVVASIDQPTSPDQALVSLQPAMERSQRIRQRVAHIQSVLAAPVIDQQPKPKPKKQLRLGNRIRQGLGLPLREELNWWQRISWKLKASFIIILVAVLFAILHITILAVIFGLLGAFLLITGLKRSFKSRRPWF
ncbi:hypothetical protein HNV11_20005 [Spirosoma taeanense]|uniref:Uncharacterized protein n=1 Tax=Spirosoma taeanense TaxID=2735870 RepID=A0A6M5YDW0_9BACT|nr:hypothetical protein [Spirosoma taeanense]QJW91500.1 hypothetical protein HNV11_20005 [Spirosoma taeanense]